MDKKIIKEYKNSKKQIKSGYKAEKKLKKREYQKEKTVIRDTYYANREAFYLENGIPVPKNPPKRSLLEEIGNAVTHGVGAVFAVFAIVLMLIKQNTKEELIGALIYSIGLFVMFGMSSLYHAFPYGSAVKRLFRRFDYSSIYLLIGATFAPILLAYIGGVKGTVFFIIQWLIIATGIALIGVFGPGKLRFIHFPLYIILGWSGLLLLPDMLARDAGFFAYIISGGIIYSLGIIPFAIKAKISHFIWHFFVLGGAVVQWLGI
ncbi:MAG: hemolysin III family protein [Clostridia bacterium]|nr:hemolysin III family protein [Clostridia bacterium]